MRAILAALAIAAAARAGVTVVDPAGGPGGALLQAAIDAAPHGEILLLKAGDYSTSDLNVSGKVLSLVGDGDPDTIVLRNLYAYLEDTDGTFLVRGVSVFNKYVGGLSAHHAGLHFEGSNDGVSDGEVWIEDCVVRGKPAQPQAQWSARGIELDAVLRAVVVRCDSLGGEGFDETGTAKNARAGGAGLISFFANVVIDECVLTGGEGGDGNSTTNTDGGHGASVTGFAAIMGSTLQGGDEGSGESPGKSPGHGFNSHGSLAGPANSVRDTVALPGDLVDGGTPAEGIHVANGTVTSFPAVARGVVVSSPLREGDAASLTFHGVPGNACFLLFAEQAGVTPQPGKQGALILAGEITGPNFVATVHPSGTATVPFVMPDLPPGTDGVVMFLQSYMLPAAGGVVSGSGSAVVWIDAAL